MNLALIKTAISDFLVQAGQVIWYKLGVAVICAALMPHALALQGLGILLALDFGCGVWVARKTRTLSSEGMRKGIGKLLLYAAFVCGIAVAEHTISDTQFCTTGALGLLAATEILSITENLVMLGLPIPYAAKVLSTVSRKARSYGFHFSSDNTEAMSYARDMVLLLDTHIPQLRNRELRTMMEIYCSQWYGFMRNCEAQMFLGAGQLAWERLQAALDRVLLDIRDEFLESKIPSAAQKTFLDRWNNDLLGKFYQQCREACLADKLTDVQQVERIREVLVLMLFRLSNEILALDRATPDPLKVNPTLEIEPTEPDPLKDLLNRNKNSTSDDDL
jgi:phage-related holin